MLLSHLPWGKVHGSTRAVVGCAAAELGELALRGRLLVRTRKYDVFGLEAHRMHGVGIELLDTAPTGLPWADATLAELAEQHEQLAHRGPRRFSLAEREGHLGLLRWLRRHHQGFALHRTALTERGVLHRRSGGLRFLTGARHLPDQALREGLAAEVRATAAGRGQLDAHALFLMDLVESVGLYKPLGISRSLRQRLDRGRSAGAAEFVPEELRDSSSALISVVPSHDNDGRYRRRRP